MTIQLQVFISGNPARINLVAELLYGNENRYGATVFHYKYSLNDGGKVDLPLDYFRGWAKRNLGWKRNALRNALRKALNKQENLNE